MGERTIRPFQDDPDEFEAASAPYGGAWEAVRPHLAKVLGAVTIIALAAAAWPLAARWFGSAGDVRVYLRGPGVGELAVGAPVAIGSVQVGRVAGFDLRDGRQVADLRIERRYRRQVSAASRFQVCSLNHWVPGNLGVRVGPPAAGGNRGELVDGAVIQAADAVLPAEIPPRFYLLVAGSVLAMAVVVIVGKVLRSVATIVAGAAVILAVIAHLTGAISAG